MVPLHALKDALTYLEEKVSTQPNLAPLYWPLIQSIELMSLGDYQREIEGAKQYAIHLLKQRMFKDSPEKAEPIANKLTEHYKRHAYVIDRQEAHDEIGLTVKDASPEVWDAMWQLHTLYDRLLKDLTKQTSVSRIFETLGMTIIR
jgi:hypothetical protein